MAGAGANERNKTTIWRALMALGSTAIPTTMSKEEREAIELAKAYEMAAQAAPGVAGTAGGIVGGMFV